MRQIDFNDCLVDGPEFRAALLSHEKHLESTNKAVKETIIAFEAVVKAAAAFSKTQREFARTLEQLNLFDEDDSSIPAGNKSTQCDDGILFPMAVNGAEAEMRQYISSFASDINVIEDNRDQWLENARHSFLQQMQNYRKEKLQRFKEDRRNFERLTQRYCNSQERYLSTKPANVTDAASHDSHMMEERSQFRSEAMDYVLKLQIDQERNKLHFTSTLLALHKVWRIFYDESKTYYDTRTQTLQRANAAISTLERTFDENLQEAKDLKQKILDTPERDLKHKGIFTLEGYLMVQQKKPIGTTWNKHFCQYRKDTRMIILTPFNQASSNTASADSKKETLSVKMCLLRSPNAQVEYERRFMFELHLVEKNTPYIVQAMSEDDMRAWSTVLEVKERPTQIGNSLVQFSGTAQLTAQGAAFLERCMCEVEARGLDEEGLYRVEGGHKRVNDLLDLSGKDMNSVKLIEWDIRVVTNAIKRYLKRLAEPLLTHDAIDCLLDARARNSIVPTAVEEEVDGSYGHAVSQCTKPKPASLIVRERLPDIIRNMLPTENRRVLKRLVHHLKLVAANSSINRMNQMNLATVFAPTLCWPRFVNLRSISQNTGLGQSIIITMMDHFDELFETTSLILAESQSTSSKPTRHTSASFSSADSLSRGRLDSQDSDVIQLRRTQVAPVDAHKRSSGSNSLNIASMYRPFYDESGSNANLLISKDRIERVLSPTFPGTAQSFRRARTRYPCRADQPSEISFQENEILLILGNSKEPGWLIARRQDGAEGLVPENYIEMLN